MSVGSFSQDTLFRAFNNAPSTCPQNGNISDNGSQSGNGHNEPLAPFSGTNDLPVGSRLFDYMNPAQAVRKISQSSTATDARTTTPNSLSSSPHFSSRMSPHAAVFQPSSTKYYGQKMNFGKADGYYPQCNDQSTPLTGRGSAIGVDLPTPPNSSDAGLMDTPDTNILCRKISKTSISSSPAPVANIAAESIGGTTYFFNTPVSDGQHVYPDMGPQQEQGGISGHGQPNIVFPDTYQYSGPVPHVGHYRARGGMAAVSYFAPNELRMDLMRRQLLCMAQTDPDQVPDLPQEVDCYHHLVHLEPVPAKTLGDRPGYFGVVTSVYKANSTKNGLAYCLRRIHNFRLTNRRCLTMLDAWKKLQHSSVVQIREIFTTKAFGDFSVVVVYDYHPAAVTVKSKHFGHSCFASSSHVDDGLQKQSGKPAFIEPKAHAADINPARGGLLPEAIIWCYIMQLSSALRQIHSSGLAARTIDPTKLIIVGKTRLLINCCGLFDLIMFNNLQQQHNVLQQHQQEDLTQFGLVILALACNNPLAAVQRDLWQQSIDLVARHYSHDLKNLILYLTASQRLRNVNDVMPMIGARFYSLLEAANNHIDMLENELTKEVDNGRLFRLLCKLGAVNERPEFAVDSHWSETGDRYLLKLFRDYLFHQVTQDGRPWLDLAHVVHCLNKLDAGTSEKIMLSSRDQQNVLIVTYADLHRCLDQAFQELLRSSNMREDGIVMAGNASILELEQYTNTSDQNA